MSESMENTPSLPTINLESSKSSDSYEINVNVLIIVVVILVVLGIGFFFWRSKFATGTVSPITPSPTVESAVTTTAPTAVATSTPTPTTATKGSPTPSVKVSPTKGAVTVKEKTTVNILNGTGATGDASYLRTKMIANGYLSDNLSTGNASSRSADAKTEVVFYSSFPSELKIDLVALLNELYASVSSTVSTDSGKYDAVVTTGKKK